MSQRNVAFLLVAIIFVLATMFRLWGIGADLPGIRHPDEPLFINVVQAMFKAGDPDPHFYDYSSLFFYIQSLAYVPYYVYGKLTGVFQTRDDILAPVMLNMGVTRTPMPTTVYLGRGVSVLFGLGTVLLTLLTGRYLVGKVVGLLAALMVAVSSAMVWHSRLITPDIVVTFAVLAAFLACAFVLQRGKTWHYVAAGVCVGLAASAKYNGAIIGVSLLTAHFLRHGRKGFRKGRIYLALLVAGATFFVTTPFVVIRFIEFASDFARGPLHYASGHTGMEGKPLLFYLTTLWRMTGPFCILALFEILRGLYQRSEQVILLSSFPVCYLAIISLLVVRNERTLLPMIPFVFLLSASLLGYLVNQARTWPSKTGRAVAYFTVSILTLFFLVGLSLGTMSRLRQFTRLHAREVAEVWIDSNLPDGTRIAIESYAPFVDPKRFSVQATSRMIDHPPEWYVDSGSEYLVFGSGMFGRFYADPERYEVEVLEYDALFEHFELVRRFTEAGGDIRIYRVQQ